MSGATRRWAPPALAPGQLRRLAWRATAGSRGAAVVGVIAAVVGGAVVAAGPTAIRIAVDDGIRAGDRTVLVVAAAVYLGLQVAGGLATAVRAVAMSHASQALLHRLRAQAMAGTLRLELTDFETADRGDLQARLTSDVDALSSASEGLLPESVSHVVAIIGGFVALVVLSPWLALAAGVFVPPALVAGRWLRARSRVVYPELFRRNATAVGVLVELTEGAPTITAHRAGSRRAEALATANERLVEQAMRATDLRNRFYGTLAVLGALATAAVLVVAAVLVDRGTVSVGTGAAAVVALAGVFGPLSWLIGGLDEILRAHTALVRVGELAALDEQAGSPPSSAVALPERGTLTMRDAHFAYVAERPVLVGVDLVVPPGERVAVVGATGSGKSTLARLVVGLAAPDRGEVLLDDVPVRSVTAASRARRLALVTQESFLVDGTIADNVRLAAGDLDGEAVRGAVDALGLAGWIASLPAGVDTEIGDDGSRLSLGERQLVALLRAAASDPAVLVLDEATSVLDPVSEAAIGTALDRASRDRAVIVIAHRPATIARCDRVVLLDGGRVFATGAPADVAGHLTATDRST